MDADLYAEFPRTQIAFNATIWASQEAAVTYITSLYLNQTSTLAIQDPSLLISGYLVDWIVKARIFTQFLKGQCLPRTSEKRELEERIAQSEWPLPVRVYGYNSLDVLFGGDLFEAETDCITKMGQIATSHTSNLAFWSSYRPFEISLPPGSPTGPLLQSPPLPTLTYDPTKIYVTLVYGDMDNLDFVTQWAYKHMIYRAEKCGERQKQREAEGEMERRRACFPFVWTLSPNLVTVAPEIMRWYYRLASQTQRDWFIMPPSGTLYSYPGVVLNKEYSLFSESFPQVKWTLRFRATMSPNKHFKHTS
jgi:hypothetical protein